MRPTLTFLSNQRALWFALIFALLGLATFGLANAPAGWRVQSLGPLGELPGIKASPQWTLTSGVVRQPGDPGTAPVVTLSARGLTQFTYVSRRFAPAPDAGPEALPDYVALAIDIRGDGLSGDPPHWPRTGVMVHNTNEDGERLWYWPYNALGSAGNHDWRHIKGLMPVADEAAHLTVMAFVLSETGEAQMRGLTVHAAEERPVYSAVYWTVVAGWLLLALSSAAALLSGPHTRVPRLATVCFAAALTLAGVTPQPLLKGLITSVSFAAQDVVADVKDWSVDRLAGWQSTEEAPAKDSEPSAGSASERSDARTDEQTSEAELESDAGVTDDDKDEDLSSLQGSEPETDRDAPEPPAQRTYWQPEFNFADKAAHLGGFALLTIAALLAWPSANRTRVVIGVACLSIAIQLVQDLLVTRDADVSDFAADMVGVLLGGILFQLLVRLPRPRLMPTSWQDAN